MSQPRDRRNSKRITLEIFLNEYMDDRVCRQVATNLSEEGMYLEGRPVRRRSSVVSMELQLPGEEETIWARGEVTHQIYDDYHHGTGVRLVGLPRLHAIALRKYVLEKRQSQLTAVLEKVRKNRDH